VRADPCHARDDPFVPTPFRTQNGFPPFCRTCLCERIIMSASTLPVTPTLPDRRGQGYGAALVLGSAVVWSFGGTLARFLAIEDGWTVVFWRSLFAALFLLGFMLLRDGPRGTVQLFRGMGLAGIAVGLCFATASTSFILALAYTTVANVVLIQAGVPLIAALMAWLLFRERIAVHTWVAIAAVIGGVAIMVSESLGGSVSMTGDALALLIAHVRMTPAVFFGTLVACAVAASQASGFAVSGQELAVLIVFGALNFGLGLALFVTGARLVPSALAALLGTAETVLAPLWVAIIHGEVPGARTIVGGIIVLAALLCYLGVELWRQRRA
jgi:drug/metabolite transporter (DMT)-like permease